MISLGVAEEGWQKFVQDLQDPVPPGHRSPSWIRGLNFLDLHLRLPPPDLLYKPILSYMVQAGKISPELWDSLFAASTQAPEPSQMILAVALAQYPVHVYTLFALRKSNEAYLSGDSGNQWGFGQVVALVLVASVLLECFRAIIGTFK